MNTYIAAKLLHYEFLKLVQDKDDAGLAALFFTDHMLEMLKDLQADNIKPEMQEKYDGYGNLMGYLSDVREKIIEEL